MRHPTKRFFPGAQTRALPVTYAAIARTASIIVLALAGFLEVCVSPTESNIACTVLATSSAMVGCLYLFREETFHRFPASAIALLGITVSTLAGPLIGQVCAWRPLDYNLEVPVETFGVCAATLLTCLGAHLLYAKSTLGQALRTSLSRGIVRRLGLLDPPKEILLWGLGALGILGTLLAGLAVKQSDQVSFGDVGGKAWQGLMLFALAPFLIPFKHLLFASREPSSRQSRVWLAGYFALLVAVALLRNSRDFFAQAFVAVTLGAFIVCIGGLVRPQRTHVKAVLVSLALGLPALVALSYVGVAMTAARDMRGSVGPVALAQETIAIVQDPERMQKRQKKYVTATAGYNDVYLDSIFLNRLVTTKYIDSTLSETSNLTDEDRAKAADDMRARFVLNLPTPILKALHININKEDYSYSGGDFYSNTASLTKLGSYLTGSAMADGLAVFGVWYWPIAFLTCCIFSCYLDAFSTSEGSVFILSPLVLMMGGKIFFGGLMGDSFASECGLYIRIIPQAALLYLAARLLFMPFNFTSKQKRPKRASPAIRRNKVGIVRS